LFVLVVSFGSAANASVEIVVWVQRSREMEIWKNESIAMFMSTGIDGAVWSNNTLCYYIVVQNSWRFSAKLTTDRPVG